MKRVCKIEGCGKKHLGLGYCNAHRQRFKRHGDPLGGRVAKGGLLKWLNEHVSYPGEECLKWPFNIKKDGYAFHKVRGRRVSASRTMCILRHGPPPTPKHEAAHSCGKGHLSCVNPNHLSWKTHAENMADMALHGSAKGPRGPRQRDQSGRYIRQSAGIFNAPSALSTRNESREAQTR